ncbi:hypothetical protein C5B42_05330 [Candidatus Cerribacteria bacterium 'Amazon FNV 2010 28 9']|uniref:Uncharacterized protein n=1 Tax=Candidatus Cerribacteria bacterium 'Amazon FNV 2010 28 9' TaxID=2081795 RepID=A0A317JM78_9BACT|nr:MAG: hypothetical protein C5B42_05330 [Candidatus Cerribacteria bacterium 'Amazon FNV 2010 28 9']
MAEQFSDWVSVLEHVRTVCSHSRIQHNTVEEALYKRAVSELGWILYFTKKPPIPRDFRLYGTPAQLLSEELEERGFTAQLSDYIQLQDIVVFANLYPLTPSFSYALLSRPQLQEGEEEFVIEGLFSKSWPHVRL